MRKMLTRNGTPRSDCNLVRHQVTAQAVGHWLLTTEGQVPSQGSICGICGGQRGTGCFSKYFSFSVNYFAVAPYSFTNHMSGVQ